MLRVALQGECFDSVHALISQSSAWDDLWLRSQGCRSAARATALAASLDAFGSSSAVSIPVVRAPDQRLLAGLVLQRAGTGWHGWIAGTPSNPWNPDVGLLWDSQAPEESTAERLAAQILGCRFPLIRLLDVPVQTAPWPSLLNALRQQGASVVITPSAGNVVLDLSVGIDAIRLRMSKSLRKSLRKARRVLDDQGGFSVRVESPSDAEEARSALERGLAIEHAGWKGTAGTSVHSVPEAHRFYRALAEDAAACGALRISFLLLGDRPIAFEIGTLSGNTYHSTKVGYDDAYAEVSPGHLLMESLLEHFAAQGIQRFDCLSPPTETLLRWGPEVEPRGRVLITQPGWAGQAVATGYRSAHGVKRWAQRLLRP